MLEASDEAGHEGGLGDLKVRTIEYLDQRILSYLIDKTSKMEEPVPLHFCPTTQHHGS